MTVSLNHTIVHVRDQEAAARFLTDLLDLPPAQRFGPFTSVQLSNGVALDYLSSDEVQSQHYAFHVSDDVFDAAFGRIQDAGLPYWAFPGGRGPGELNHRHGGRGFYFSDPDGHHLELLTRLPSGSD